MSFHTGTNGRLSEREREANLTMQCVKSLLFIIFIIIWSYNRAKPEKGRKEGGRERSTQTILSTEVCMHACMHQCTRTRVRDGLKTISFWATFFLLILVVEQCSASVSTSVSVCLAEWKQVCVRATGRDTDPPPTGGGGGGGATRDDSLMYNLQRRRRRRRRSWTLAFSPFLFFSFLRALFRRQTGPRAEASIRERERKKEREANSPTDPPTNQPTKPPPPFLGIFGRTHRRTDGRMHCNTANAANIICISFISFFFYWETMCIFSKGSETFKISSF